MFHKLYIQYITMSFQFQSRRLKDRKEEAKQKKETRRIKREEKEKVALRLYPNGCYFKDVIHIVFEIIAERYLIIQNPYDLTCHLVMISDCTKI